MIIFFHPINLVFVNQLLSITYNIFYSFDEGLETRPIFLDISKAFDKIWPEGPNYKLHQCGFTGNLLALLTDFLSNDPHGQMLKQVFVKVPS